MSVLGLITSLVLDRKNTDSARRSVLKGFSVGQKLRWLTPVLLAMMVLLAGCASSGQTGTDAPTPETVVDDSDRILTGTNNLQPGRFTRFPGGRGVEDGLLIGVHPKAGIGTVSARVERIDPTGEQEFQHQAEGVAKSGPFYEIHAEGIKDSFLRTSPDTGFFIALPVPEDLNDDALVPLIFREGEFSHIKLSNKWIRTSGPYDPEHRVLILSLSNIGSREHPTRVGVVEHAKFKTEMTESVLTPLLTKHFPNAERNRKEDAESNIRKNQSGGETSSGPRAPLNRPTSYLDHRSKHTAEWTFRCRASNCPSSDLSTIRSALNDALDEYVKMNGNPRPSIGTTWGSKFMPNKSIYKVNIGDDGWDSKCTGGRSHPDEAAGWHIGGLNRLVICLGASNIGLTASHELFHSMQYNLASHWATSEDVVVEATADLAEDWNSLETPGSNNPPDLNSPLASLSYDGSFFYSHLLRNSSRVEFEDLGDLFADGSGNLARSSLQFDPNLRDWVSSKTSGDLGNAFWAYAKDVFYENQVAIGNGVCQVTANGMISNSKTFSASSSSRSIPADDTEYTLSHAPLSGRVWDLTLPASGFDPYRLKVTVAEKNYMMKLYDDHVTQWEPRGCWSGALEARGDRTIELPVYEKKKTAYLLVGDLIEDKQVTTSNNPTHTYQVEFTFEKIPSSQLPYPVAPDISLTLPPGDDKSATIDALTRARNPHGSHDLLVIADPGKAGKRTSRGNRVSLNTSSNKVEWTLKNDGFFGDDTFTYTVDNEKTGLDDQGTVTITRTKQPNAVDDRFGIPKPTAISWEQNGWSQSTTSPVTIDVLSNDYNPLDFAGSSWDRDLTIPSANAKHGKVKVVDMGTGEMLRYWPDPDGEQAWSSNARGLRYYKDQITYTAKNDADQTDQAEVKVVFFSPDLTAFGGDDEVPPPGTVCNLVQSGRYSAMTMMEGDDPRTYVHSEEAGEWFSLESSTGPALAQASNEFQGSASVQDISEDGRVVGWSADPDRGSIAFVWDKSHGARPLPAPAGHGSAALAVNDRGTIVGMVFDPDGEGMPTAAMWRDGKLHRLGAQLDGASLATDIGGRGQIVGIHGGKVQEGSFPQSPGGPSVSGCDDIDEGPPRIGGGDDGGIPEECPSKRFRGYGVGNGAQGFGISQGGFGKGKEVFGLGGGDNQSFVPKSVNGEGRSSGFIPRKPGGKVCPTWGASHDGSRVRTLQPLEGDGYSNAQAINDAGLVAGMSGNMDGERRGILWHQSIGTVNLNHLVSTPEGWRIASATGFNGAGELIVVTQNPEGQMRPLSISLNRLAVTIPSVTSDTAPKPALEEIKE